YDNGTGPFTGGASGGPGFGGFGNFDFDASSMGAILSNLFEASVGGGGSAAPGGGGAGGRRARARPQRGRDLETEVRISFDQSISGAQVPLSVPTSSICGTCHGTGEIGRASCR